MSNSDDLNGVFGPLRSNAVRAELADEATIVDAMAHAHNASKGHTAMLRNSRKARVATLIAAGIIGFGGVAAAGPGGLTQSIELPTEEPVETTIATTVPDEPDEPEPSTPTTEAPETSVVETTEAPPEEPEDTEELKKTEEDVEAPVASLEDDPDTAFDETTCLDGNHGETVSAVAHGDEPFADVEVRDAAHSKCGKKSASGEADEAGAERDDEDDDADHDTDSDDDDDDDDKPDKGEKAGKEKGNSSASDHSNNRRGKNPKGD